MRTAIVTMALIALTGCSTLSAPAPDATTPATDPRAQAIRTAQTVGLLGCAVLAGELQPAELDQARVATAAAVAVLGEPEPSLVDLTLALSHSGLPPRYVLLSSILIQQLKVELGAAEVLPTGSTGWAVATAYLTSCGAGLASSV